MNDRIQDGAYVAHAFHPELPAGRSVSGELRVEPNRVVFQARADGAGAGRRIELPLRGIAMKLGGANDRLIFFSHPDHPDISVYTTNHAILKNPAFEGNAELLEAVQGVKRKRNMLRAGFLGVLLTGVAIVVALVLLKEPAVRLAASQVPPSMETQIGQAVLQQLQAEQTFITEPAALGPLKEIGEAITSKMSTRYAYEFHIVDDPTINAFALPGGAIVFHSGLIENAKATEEVAGVMAHEIAHVEHQHGLRQLINSAGMIVILQAVLGDLSGLSGAAAAGGFQLARLSYSRSAEREADDSGFDYLIAADIDPAGMVDFFETLEEKHGGAGVPAILSTHPATVERIAHLKEKVDGIAGQEFAGIDLDFAAFQDAARSASVATPSTGPVATPVTRGAGSPDPLPLGRGSFPNSFPDSNPDSNPDSQLHTHLSRSLRHERIH